MSHPAYPTGAPLPPSVPRLPWRVVLAVLGPVVAVDAAALLLPGPAPIAVTASQVLLAWIGVLVCLVLAGARPVVRSVGRSLALAIPLGCVFFLAGLAVAG